MQITFNLQRVLSPGSSLETSLPARRILDDCLARLNRAKSHNGIDKALYRIDGHCVMFDIPNAFNPDATKVANAESLQALLECLISFNLLFINRCPNVPDLYTMGEKVVYVRTQVWDAIPELYVKGYGDCKSLSAAIIAQYRYAGIDAVPVFRFSPPRPDGGLLFHILVQTPNGYEDPSKAKGMGQDENRWFRQS